METNNCLKIHKGMLPFLNISFYLNNQKFIYSLSVENCSEEIVENVEVRIVSDIPCIEEFSFIVSAVPPGTIISVPLDGLKVNRDFLNQLSETEKAEIRIEVRRDQNILASEVDYLQVHPLEYFGGLQVLPQFIASFVTPNHSYVYHIKRRAVELLEAQRLKPSFEGYQSADPGRVLQIMSALYTAIQHEQIIYSAMPPGYEETGQRLRLLSTIQKEKFANCIDISLLLAACLEAADLHPLLIIVRGHAFVGCWLTDDKFPEVISDDKTAITKRASKGIREIAVIEATTMCRGKDISFSDALQMGEAQLVEKEDFLFSVDIKTARSVFIRPIPLLNTEAVALDMEEVEKAVTGNFEEEFEIGKIYTDELLDKTGTPVTKLKIWERKLLDLSLRNNLLNLRFSRNMLQLVDIDIHKLEDVLWDGKSFSIQPHPSASLTGRYNLYSLPLHASSPEYQKANEELKYYRLLTNYHQRDLDNMLDFMHKNAKQALEESGSSTLFLGVGLLKWHDRKTPNVARYAPILLIPVEINRRSVNSRFTLKSREEETMINITLLEFLRQEYQMNLRGLEELPQDEKGVDVAKVMGILRRAIMQLEGWDVMEQLVLGNFSFSKLILWNDIVINQAQLLQSNIVRSLVEGRLLFPVGNGNEHVHLEDIPSGQLMLPIATDASQMSAVLASQQGETFILHGPPGTGKSQTITNIIADAMYQGKRVLFVAAKKAALDVVYKRLKEIGLEPFTLELHSNKSKKSDVLNQLAQSLETIKDRQVENFADKSHRLDEARIAISAYVRLLHQQQPTGWSLYDSLTALESYRDANFSRNFIPDQVLAALDSMLWQRWNDWLPGFAAIVGLILHPSQNPLSQLHVEKYSTTLSDDIAREIEGMIKTLASLKRQLPEIIDRLDFPFDVETTKEMDALIRMTGKLQSLPNTSLQFAVFLSDGQNQDVFEDWRNHFQLWQSSLSLILSENSRTVLELNVPALEHLWREASRSWFLPQWIKRRKVKKQLNVHRLQKITDDVQIATFFENYRKMREASRLLERGRYKEVVTALKNLYQDEETELGEIDSRVLAIREIVECMEGWGYHSFGNWLKRLMNEGIVFSDEFIKPQGERIDHLSQSFQKFAVQREALSSISGYRFIEATGWLDQNIHELTDIARHLPRLRDWLNYRQICEQGRKLHLDWLISAFEHQSCTADNVTEYFLYTTHLSMARRIISQHESLSLFNTGLFESKIEQYKQIAQEYKSLTIEELTGKLASALPRLSGDAMQSSEPGILQKAIRSKGRGMSIRKLFDQIPNLLPRLAPCMLMSPISAAQYFDMDSSYFDLVIFDEASQLPTCEAISSLARAKQAIIVGDPKQMPPTSFFTTTRLDEENIEIEDLESILDDCLALSMPSRYLLRHYRSRHESLIAFSNVSFYENKLLTFPSADDLHRKVQYHHVPGVYDKGKTRTNRFEADAVIRFINSHYENKSKRHLSVGVVTFSQAQQNLMEEKLDELFRLNAQLEEWATLGEEPLFVKNLENVQGDERDIILFSIGYGPDEHGTVSMNFGPLNREGGWRRLNVAVTRARFEMHIFATLKAEQIDLSRTSAEGVAGLKNFLSFAESGKLALKPAAIEQQLSMPQLSDSVRQKLGEKGLKVECNIGTSGFKVDVGIVHPQRPHEFILGVIIDGHHYYNAQTSNDRELVMPSVLRSLGWNIYRIWSLDWHENADQIVNAIVDKVAILLENPEVNEPVGILPGNELAPLRSVTEPSKPTKPATLQRPYIALALTPVLHSGNDAILDWSNRATLKRQIASIISVESPVSQNTLFRKVLQAWGISRIGSRLEKYLEEIVLEMKLKQKQHRQRFYYNDLPVAHYRSNDKERRKAEDIAPEEIVLAIEEAVRNHFSIEQCELIRYIARTFDFARVGSQVEASVEYAIETAVREGKVIRSDGRISAP